MSEFLHTIPNWFWGLLGLLAFIWILMHLGSLLATIGGFLWRISPWIMIPVFLIKGWDYYRYTFKPLWDHYEQQRLNP